MRNLSARSGRESLSPADRAGLLESDLFAIRKLKLKPKVRYETLIPAASESIPSHDFNQLVCLARATIHTLRLYGQAGVDLWRVSYCEALIMAWKRGGFDEYRNEDNVWTPKKSGVTE